MVTRKSAATTDTAADNAATVPTASVAVDWSLGAAERISAIEVGFANMQTEHTSPAVAAAQKEVANITVALNMLASGSAAHIALTAALEVANGALALAEAQAADDAAHAAEIASANAAADAHNLTPEVRAAMLAAIETKYAPAPAVEVVPEQVAPEVASGKKQVSARTAAINAAAADVDLSRAAETLAAFDRSFAGDLAGVARTSGTRFCSLAAFGGNGVAGSADYQSLVAQIRRYMRYTLGVNGAGDSYATAAWLFATGLHAAGAAKGADSLPLKFVSRAAIALFPDGRFRLALPNTPEVRFVARDSGALALWHGGSAAQVAPAPTTAQVAPTVPAAPTPPAVAASASGAIVDVATCQHCGIRNPVTASACKICRAADWNGRAA